MMTHKEHKMWEASRMRATRSLAFIMALFLMFAPAPSFAQCEAPGTIEGAQAGIDDEMRINIEWLGIGTAAGWANLLDGLRAQLGVTGRDLILAALHEFWDRWGGAWKSMTKQLSAGTALQTLEWGRYNDVENTAKVALEVQKQKLRSKLLYQPTDETCRFDTLAAYMTPSRQISRALENGYEWDIMKEGNNIEGSFGQYGPGNLQEYLWQAYSLYFCDAEAEGGHKNSGCDTSGPLATWDVLPSKTIFSRETIHLEDYSKRVTLWQLIYNITGYKVPTPVLKGSLKSPQGMDEMMKRRSYLAQMDAVSALLYHVIAERVPGLEAREVRDLRTHEGGSPATDAASTHEIRQAIVEQLWDPGYYKNLYDNPSTIAQKEIYLKAYNLMMLYDLIAKQERISNVYAIQTSNILQRADISRGSAASGQPVKQ